MSDRSKIEWTDASWTPIKARNPKNGKSGWHCVKVSPACAHCYSETFNARGLPNGGTGLPFSVNSPAETYLDESVLMQPLKWRKPRKVFVCSMTDLFGEWVPDETIDRVFSIMARCPMHTFQVLTKRAERMRAYLSTLGRRGRINDASITSSGHYIWFDIGDEGREHIAGPSFPLPNVWCGVSVENQKYADERIPHLINTPAAVRFLSCEPLLGDIDLEHVQHDGTVEIDCLRGTHGVSRPHAGSNAKIDQVIIGGESGAGARECKFEWIRSLLRQCKASGCAAFVKQLGKRPSGEWGPNPPMYHLTSLTHGVVKKTVELSQYKNGIWKLRDKKGGWIEEFPADLRIRQFPEVSHATR